MSEVYNQYKPTTYRLLRGLRRSIPDVPELTNAPPVPKQKRRVKLVAIYGQPIIAHCINQGEFLYPKVVGHKIIQLDDDDETMSPDTTDDDTRKPHGTYGCFTVEDYQFLKNNTSYQRIRIKLSSSALDIRPWRIGGTTATKDLLPSTARRAWAGYIEATLSVDMPINATNDRKHDVCNKMEALSSSDAARAIMAPGRMVEPAAVTDMTGLSRYKDQVCKCVRGLRLTMAETAYRVNQVERQEGLVKTIVIDLTAMANHVKGDQFVHWMAVGQLLAWSVGNGQRRRMDAMPTRDASVTAIGGLCSNKPVDVYSKLNRKKGTSKLKREDDTCSSTAGGAGHVDIKLTRDKESIGRQINPAVGLLLAWLVGNGQRRRMDAMSIMPTRDASDTAIGALCSNQPVDVYSKLNRKKDTSKLKREDDTCSSTAGDAGHVNTELSKDKESIGHHTKSAENQGLFEETSQAAHGCHGDTVEDSHDESQEKAAQPDQIDDDDEERIIRVEHLWSADDDEEQNSKSVSAIGEHGCPTPATREKHSSKSISAIEEHGCLTAARVEEDDDSWCGVLGLYATVEEQDPKSISAMAEHGCHTAARVEEDDDSWCGVLGLYASGQAGVFF